MTEGMPTLPRTIYHYCPGAAFAQIVANGHLWLSDFREMNDYMEGEWAYNLVDKCIQERAKRNGKDLFTRLIELWHLNKLRRPSGVESMGAANALNHLLGNRSSAFLTCFSQDGDVLSQWRAYADDGRGVAIGFDPCCLGVRAGLAYPSDDANVTLGLSRVIYERETQTQMVTTMIDQFLHDILNGGKNPDAAALEFVVPIAAQALTMKNPAFQEEREWRVIHTPLITDYGTADVHGAIGEMRFRWSDDTMIPYFTLPFRTGGQAPAITEVVLGPRSRATWSTVKAFLARHGYPETTVRKSPASYR